MANAVKDDNYIPTLIAVSDTDGSTPIRVRSDPTLKALLISNASTGSDLSGDRAYRDNNNITTMLVISESDGITPTPVYADASTGKLLVDST